MAMARIRVLDFILFSLFASSLPYLQDFRAAALDDAEAACVAQFPENDTLRVLTAHPLELSNCVTEV